VATSPGIVNHGCVMLGSFQDSTLRTAVGRTAVGRTTAGRAGGGSSPLLGGQNSDGGGQPRDWKKLSLVIGLGVLSWVATYVGMLELIEANMGELPLIHKVITGFSVAMLMIMIVWLLDQLFAPNGFFIKTLYAIGYLSRSASGSASTGRSSNRNLRRRGARKRPSRRFNRRCMARQRGSNSCRARSCS
jgi:hypothetical protein